MCAVLFRGKDKNNRTLDVWQGHLTVLSCVPIHQPSNAPSKQLSVGYTILWQPARGLPRQPNAPSHRLRDVIIIAAKKKRADVKNGSYKDIFDINGKQTPTLEGLQTTRYFFFSPIYNDWRETTRTAKKFHLSADSGFRRHKSGLP